MSRTNVLMTAILVAGAAFVARSARATDVSGSGKNMFVNKVLETFNLADGTTANRVLSNGFIAADDPASPLYLASMTCSGMSVMRGAVTINAAGTCDSVDSGGDVAFYWWRYDEKGGGRWGFLGGTGKWSGVEGGGTYAPAYAWKDGRTGNTWKGAWKTK